MMTTWLGHRRIDLECVDSTNDEAAELAGCGAAHGTVVIALEQRAGRGRQARSWYSPPGENLYMSIVLRPVLESAQVPAITLAAGIAVADAVRGAGIDATLKWPNDVLIDGRKLAGILTEMTSRGNRVEHVIVGIGVNLTCREFPGELSERATSLGLCGAVIERERFIDDLCDHLEIWLDRFFAGGVTAIAAAWLERAGLGSEAGPMVRVQTQGGQPIVGRMIGLDDHGFLQVQDDSGTIHRIVAGDVEISPSQP